MSKTTEKLGKPIYTLNLRVDSDPVLPKHLEKKFELWDDLCKKTFNKPYDALSDNQKSEFHFNLNCGVYKNE